MSDNSQFLWVTDVGIDICVLKLWSAVGRRRGFEVTDDKILVKIAGGYCACRLRPPNAGLRRDHDNQVNRLALSMCGVIFDDYVCFWGNKKIGQRKSDAQVAEFSKSCVS